MDNFTEKIIVGIAINILLILVIDAMSILINDISVFENKLNAIVIGFCTGFISSRLSNFLKK